MIGTKLCTFHDNTAVVVYAKLCRDLITRSKVTVNQFSVECEHWWIMKEDSSVKRAPDRYSQNKYLLKIKHWSAIHFHDSTCIRMYSKSCVFNNISNKDWLYVLSFMFLRVYRPGTWINNVCFLTRCIRRWHQNICRVHVHSADKTPIHTFTRDMRSIFSAHHVLVQLSQVSDVIWCGLTRGGPWTLCCLKWPGHSKTEYMHKQLWVELSMS